MRIELDLGLVSLDLKEQWSEWFSKDYNWQSFDLIKVSWEKENIHGTLEIELYVLGLGVRIYWVYDKELMETKMKEYEVMMKKEKWVER